MKRILKENKVDYKLSPNLNKKIKNKWSWVHYKKNKKDKKGAKLKYTAYQEQAGVIITRWAKRLLETREINYKKNKARRRRKIHSKSRHHHKCHERNTEEDEETGILGAETRKHERQKMY